MKSDDGHPLAQVERADDLVDPVLVRTVGDDDHLQVTIPVIRDQAVEDFRQKLGPFLHRVEAGGPEEDRRVDVLLELELALQRELVSRLAFGEIRHAEIPGQRVIREWIVGNIRRVENPRGTSGRIFGAQLGPHGIRHHRVPALDDFPEEARTHRVDEVGGENSGR